MRRGTGAARPVACRPGRATRTRAGSRRCAERRSRRPRALPRSPDRARARQGRRRRPHPRARRARRAPSTSTPPGPVRDARARRSRGCRTRRSRRSRRPWCRSARAPPGQREHPRDVEGDVAVPDDDRALVREVELEVLEVGVAVVPGNELGGRPRPGQIFARDARAAGRSASPLRRPPRRTRDASSSCVTSRPTSTLPRKRKPGRAAIFSNARDTVLSCGWSGATPSRTSPQGVGSRSIMSTSTPGSSDASRTPAA